MCFREQVKASKLWVFHHKIFNWKIPEKNIPENTREEQNKITFNLTYYPAAFQNVKNVLAELHLLLIPDDIHNAVFTSVPIIGFKNDRSLKDHLVRAVLPKVDLEGTSKPWRGGGGGGGRHQRDVQYVKRPT